MNKIISISNIKGGVGKSTIAINLSAALSFKSDRVYLIDADPQGTVSDWNRTRHNNTIPHIHNNIIVTEEPYTFNDIKNKLNKESKNYDYTIIDCPPEDDRIMRASLVYSDYTIIPVTPSPFDIRSANKTIKTIKEGIKAKAIKTKPYIIISKKIMGTVLGREARETLETFGIPILKTEITQKIALCESGISGKTIYEYERNSRSAEEFTKLGKEIQKWRKKA